MASPIKNCIRIFLSFVAILFAVLLLRAITFPSYMKPVKECKPDDYDFIPATSQVIDRLKNAITYQTISYDIGNQRSDELKKFVDYLVTAYPAIRSSPLVQREVIANYSLLYTVQGSDQSLLPYLLTSHSDVVPVSEESWDVPPFEGREVDGYIYGRGTIDAKHILMGVLEALEFRLLKNNHPKRTLLIAFGHDEEILGLNGAGQVTRVLQSRYSELEFLLDEGMMLLDEIIPLISKRVAIIGVAEKGYATLSLSVDTGVRGHSSMPPRESSIGILAKAVSRLEDNPLPSMFGKGPEAATFEHMASEMEPAGRFIMSNIWFFQSILSWFLSKKPSTNAVIRTTSAITMFNAGIKDNVIPATAMAVVNHRIHNAQTLKEVVDYDVSVIDDERVKVEVISGKEPSFISPYDQDAYGYQTITHSLQQIFPEAVIVPGTLIGATDTYHYFNLTRNIYRFSPVVNKPEDLSRFHGDNERISATNYEQLLNFYYHVMINADSKSVPNQHTHNTEL